MNDEKAQSPPGVAGFAGVHTFGNSVQANCSADAARFLNALDPAASSWTFQTFDDNEARRSGQLARVLHGTLDEHAGTLEELNRQGAGVFVTVNETDGKGRERENILRVRAVFADFDGTPLPDELPLTPHMVVQSSPQRWHVYWRVDGLPLDQFKTIQQAIAGRFGSDRKVCDVSRVMRVPGFEHRKGDPVAVQLCKVDGFAAYSAEMISSVFPLMVDAPRHSQESAPGMILEGSRNTELTSLAGRLRNQGLSEKEILDVLVTRNQERCRPPLSLKEVSEIARSIGRYPPGSNTGAPEPLRRPLPPAAAYPMDALGDVLGNAARAIHTVVQAPEALCGLSLLAAASLACQAHANVMLEGRSELLSLWGLTIGESGERKSAVDEWALRPHRDHERRAMDAYQIERGLFAQAMAAHDAASRNAMKGVDPARIQSALELIGAPPEPPLVPLLLVAEPTLEGMQKQLIQGEPSIGLFSDDAGDFLGGYAMSKDNRTKTVAILSKLWDSGSFDRVRAGDGTGKYYGRRLAVHFMMQPIIAESVLSDPLLIGQGFLPRCLLAWPSSTIGTRRYVERDLSHDPAVMRYWACMARVLALKPRLRQGTRNELEPRVLTLAADAKALWMRVQDSIEAAMGDRGEFAAVRAWASKAGAQVQRVAGVLTLVDDSGAGVIQADRIERAARLVWWHLLEAARIVGTAAVPAEVRNAEKLLAWCRESQRDLLCSNEALRKGPSSIRTKDAFEAAVKKLADAGWAESVKGGASIDGKHYRRVWKISGGQ